MKRSVILNAAALAFRGESKLVDRFNQQAVKHDVPCTSCAEPWCCYQLTLATVYEGILLADKLQGHDELLQLVLDHGAQQERIWNDQRYEQDGRDVVTKLWLDKRIPCPLLINNRCREYELRPVSCSSYWIVGDPQQCKPPSGKMVSAADNTLPLLNSLQLQYTFNARIGLGITPEPLPLGVAVRVGKGLLDNAEVLRPCESTEVFCDWGHCSDMMACERRSTTHGWLPVCINCAIKQ